MVSTYIINQVEHICYEIPEYSNYLQVAPFVSIDTSHEPKQVFHDYDKQLIELAQKTKPTWLSQYLILLIDEMYVKEGLVFNKSSGALIGIVELGDIDDHLRIYECHSGVG